MFAPRTRPLIVLEDRLLALRPSLNTPVLATAEIPSGPARAAIFAYAEGGERRYAVVVHALRAGTAVIYELRADVPDDEDGWSVALDSALSFGESMGFLFDDEVVLDRDPDTLRRAVMQLRELIAPGELPADEPEPDAQIGSPEDLAEILLEDELEPVQAPADDASESTGPLEFVPQAFAPGIALSKFRMPPPPPAPVEIATAAVESLAAVEPAPTRGKGGAKLGRVRPKRVRIGKDASPPADPLLRLLADF